MMRRVGTAVLVGGLALATMVLVVIAIRPETPPAASAAPIKIGALAVSGDSMWRWSGPSDCNADTDIIQVQQRTGDGDWTGYKIPLANVYSLNLPTNPSASPPEPLRPAYVKLR